MLKPLFAALLLSLPVDAGMQVAFKGYAGKLAPEALSY